MLPNRSVPDVQEKREEFLEQIASILPETVEKLVFIDESGVSTNLVLRYGRAIGGARVADNAHVNTPTNTTVIAGMTASGPVAYATWSGGTKKEQRTDWVRTTLIPDLRPGQIVVWDTLRAHHRKMLSSCWRMQVFR